MWDERYQDSEYVYGTKPNEFLESIQLTPETGRKVLCLAEGEGRNAVYLAKLGFDVLAVDQSVVGLRKALKLASSAGTKICIEQVNLEDYRIPFKSYDGIVSIFGHFDYETRKHMHEQVKGGLKKGGFLILEAYSKDQIHYNTGGPKETDMLYDLQEFEKDFSGILNYHVKRKIKREVIEGKYHTGLGSVIQIFAFKK